MLAWLWTRLSDGGPHVSLSGRALRRFPEGEVDRLLRARVLIERRKADNWPVCAHCDCGLDARPVRHVGEELRACCPLDAAEDVVLEDGDLSRFGIDAGRLAGRIAASGGLAGPVSAVVDGVWTIGTTPSGVAVVLCSDLAPLDSPGTVLAIKAAVGGAASVVVGHDFGAPLVLRLKEAGLSAVEIGEALDPDADRLRTDSLGKVARSASLGSETESGSEPRLQIFRGRRTLRFDGRDIVLSMVGFDAFVGAAEKVVAGEVMLTYQEIHSLTNRASHRDVLKEIRDQLEQHGITREDAFALVKTKHGRGITIGLSPDDIVIRD